MHPKLFPIFVLLLAVAISVLIAWLVGMPLKMGLFAADPESALLLAWSVGIPVVYTAMRFGGLKIGLPAGLTVGLAAAAVWNRTLGDVDPVFISLPLGLMLIALLFEQFWGQPKVSILRNLMFGMMAAFVNSLSTAVALLFAGQEITALSLLGDYRIGLLAALMASVAVTLAERIYIPLAWRWGVPGLFTEEEALDDGPFDDDSPTQQEDV